MTPWLDTLKGDPLPWLLEEETPAVRHLALRQLLDQPEDAPLAGQARDAAMHTDPIASILAAEQPEGFWVKPGPGYNPKYRGTVWQLTFLDQLGADGTDARVQAACNYVLSHSQARTGGFASWEGGSRPEAPPPPALVIHCLDGNLLLALTRIPADRRAPHVERAIEQGAAFLLSCDPLTAAYPAGWGNVEPSPSWFKLGFPLGYVADLLQNLTVLSELGFAKDARLQGAVEWLLGQQEPSGRWRNQSAYHGKTWVEIDKQDQPSKWVTLRACVVLKAVYG